MQHQMGHVKITANAVKILMPIDFELNKDIIQGTVSSISVCSSLRLTVNLTFGLHQFRQPSTEAITTKSVRWKYYIFWLTTNIVNFMINMHIYNTQVCKTAGIMYETPWQFPYFSDSVYWNIRRFKVKNGVTTISSTLSCNDWLTGWNFEKLGFPVSCKYSLRKGL